LSDTYFTNRQDRYVLISNDRLADFYGSLLSKLTQLPFCHTVTRQGPAPAPLAHPLGGEAETPDAEWSHRKQIGASVADLFKPRAEAADLITTADANADTLVFPTLQMVSHAATMCSHGALLVCSWFLILVSLIVVWCRARWE
jgi:hypothetical protein